MAATFIASRSASPRQGILLVAGMNFSGAILGGSAVAMTISGLLTLDPGEGLVSIVLVALIAVAVWDIITWRFGLPSSSTHALIGGLKGARIAAAGLFSISWDLSEVLTSPHQLGGMVNFWSFWRSRWGLVSPGDT